MANSGLDMAPAFYVVGAARSGTTALWSWLRRHPDVFLPTVKEPGFFAYSGRSAVPRRGPYDPDYVAEITTTAQAYYRLYEPMEGRLSGDVSPIYLIDAEAAGRIAETRPDARIVILLRDPVSRAFSQFLQHRRDGIEPLASFEAALLAEEWQLRQGWSWGHGYRVNGCYGAQIARYLDVFEQHQILFLAFEALQSAPETCWHRLCRHLGLPPCSMPQNRRVNVSSTLVGLPAWPWISRHIHHPGPLQKRLKHCLPRSFATFVRRRVEAATSPMPLLLDSTRHALADHYQQERRAVGEMSGLSLEAWSR
ncbi:MAG: sulfotransferase [Rhodobacteraceae bacterium]|nr:sulfotransferase [Paracoccaceae bacterium]